MKKKAAGKKPPARVKPTSRAARAAALAHASPEHGNTLAIHQEPPRPPDAPPCAHPGFISGVRVAATETGDHVAEIWISCATCQRRFKFPPDGIVSLNELVLRILIEPSETVAPKRG